MGLFSGLYKPEINEYIAVKDSGRGQKAFTMGILSAAPLLHLSADLGSNTSVRECTGSGADGWSILSGAGDGRDMRLWRNLPEDLTGRGTVVKRQAGIV